MRTSAAFLLGLAVGSLAVVLAKRLRQVTEEEGALGLADKLAAQLEHLEKRTHPKPKAVVAQARD